MSAANPKLQRLCENTSQMINNGIYAVEKDTRTMGFSPHLISNMGQSPICCHYESPA